MISADVMATVLLQVCAKLANPYSHVDILVSWMLHTYDRSAVVALSIALPVIPSPCFARAAIAC